MPAFVLPGRWPGLLIRGNIDITARTKVAVPNPKGGTSSVLSASASYRPDEDTGRVRVPGDIRAMLASKKLFINILFPCVVRKGGKWAIVSPAEGRNRALSSGRHLGVFDSVPHANAYANALHLEQERDAPARGRRVIIKDKDGRKWNCLQTVRNGRTFLNDCRRV